MLEGFHDVGAGIVDGDVNLDAAAHVLDRRKAGLAHDALEHDAAGDGDSHCGCCERFGFGSAVFVLQRLRQVAAHEVVGVGDAGGADGVQFPAAFGNEFFVVLRGFCRIRSLGIEAAAVFVGHD